MPIGTGKNNSSISAIIHTTIEIISIQTQSPSLSTHQSLNKDTSI
jgi:hypothetical protein